MLFGMKVGSLSIDGKALKAACERWGIAELAAFGSVIRDDFRPESDVDLLVTFLDPRRWRFRDLLAMEAELTEIFGHRVELVEIDAVAENPNPITRRRILESAITLNVA